MARGTPTGACTEWHAFVGILQILHQGREKFEAMNLLSWTSYFSLRQRDCNLSLRHTPLESPSKLLLLYWLVGGKMVENFSGSFPKSSFFSRPIRLVQSSLLVNFPFSFCFCQIVKVMLHPLTASSTFFYVVQCHFFPFMLIPLLGSLNYVVQKTVCDTQ